MFERQARIASLGHGATKGVQNTRILLHVSLMAELIVKLVAITGGELRHTLNPEGAEIRFNRAAYASQIAQTAMVDGNGWGSDGISI